ncbi:MAG: hypothetical protein AAB774_02070 [Patescibacteria group bacterium]
MQISTVTKVILGFAFGAIVGGGVISAIATLDDTSSQLAFDSVQSGIKVSQSNYPPMPPCSDTQFTPEQRAQGMHCPTEAEYQQMMQQQNQQQQQQQQTQPPPTGQNSDPNQTQNQQPQPNSDPNYRPPAGQTVQTNPNPNGSQPPPNGQNPNQSQDGQPGQPGQFGQPGQPFNAASTNIGPPPELNFQRPAGLDDPDKCFREKGGEALVTAVKTGRMTPALMSTAGSCFSARFNAAPGQGQPGQGGPNDQGGAPGQAGQPFGQMTIFSGEFIKNMSSVKPPSNDCVVKIAGEAVAEKMFGQGIQPDNATRDKIFKAGCFGPPPSENEGQNGPNGQSGAPGRQFAGPPLEVVDCLNKIAGNGDIQSGKRNPTPTEFNAGQACYAKAGATPFFVPPSQVPENSPLALCAKAVIGVTDISTITPDSLTRAQKQRMRTCYAPSGDQAMANTQPSLSQEAADCIKKVMGEAAFSQVSTGRLEPTAEQRKAGAVCFPKKGLSKIAELSEAAVPKTQAEALMADVDASLVSEPTVIAPTTEEVSQNPDESNFELTGEVTEGETVDIYYNSDATIVTAETKDATGGKKTWSTDIAYSSLSQDEKHTAYAVTTKSDGTAVRSPLIAFEAKAADPTTDSTTGTGRNMLILYGVLGALALAVIGFVIVRRRHKAVV